MIRLVYTGAIAAILWSQPVSSFSTATPTASSATKKGSALSMVTPKKVLIVGGGIGGLSSAFDTKHNLRPTDEVTVVSDRTQFQFTPSNPWVATRKRKAEDISLPLKEVLPRHGIQFVEGKATRLDPKKKMIHLEDGTSLQYDYLLIATGPRLAFDEIPGATKSTVSVCTTPHASHTAEAVDGLTKDPGPIVIGATQGASCFGPAYEFAFLLYHELYKRGGDELISQCPMTFITAEPYIGHLGLKGAGKSQEILEALLKQKSIDYHVNCEVNKVDLDSITITTMDEHKRKHKSKIPSKLTMIIPPFRGQPVWSKVPNLTDANGMIKINEHQQSTAYPEIFGVGVAVSIPPIEQTPIPTGAPKTGYMIESQGTAAIKNIRTMMDFKEKHPNESAIELRNRPLLNGLCITDFGDEGAIFLTMPQYPPRRTDVTLHGKPALLAKIAFEKYFLHKISSGDTDPYYERYMLHLIGVDRITSKPKATE